MPKRFLKRILDWEHALVHRLQEIMLPDKLNRLLMVFMRVGDGWGWAVVAGILFAFLPWVRLKFILGQTLLAVAISLPVYWGIKFSLKRSRPFLSHPGGLPRVPPLDRYSFPSGHTMNNLAVAMTLALNIPKLWPFALSIPLTLGLLRILYGVHFLTDIAAGAILGALSSITAHFIFPRLFT